MLTDDFIDECAGIKPKFRLKYNKNLTTKQKRAIRGAFNRIQPEFIEKVNKHMFELVAYGETVILEA